MEEKKDEAAVGGGAKGCCGVHCGCCACKAIKGLVLILIGAAIGFGIGRCFHRGCHRGMCRMESGAAERSENAEMPAAAPKKTK
jgi:hypothetical protein